MCRTSAFNKFYCTNSQRLILVLHFTLWIFITWNKIRVLIWNEGLKSSFCVIIGAIANLKMKFLFVCFWVFLNPVLKTSLTLNTPPSYCCSEREGHCRTRNSSNLPQKGKVLNFPLNSQIKYLLQISFRSSHKGNGITFY